MHARTWFLAGAVMALGIANAAEAACQLSNIQLEGPNEGTRRLSAWWPDHGAPMFALTSDLGTTPQNTVLACADAECDIQSLNWLDAGANGASAPAVFADSVSAQPSIVAAHANGLMLYRCTDPGCTTRQTLVLPNTEGITLHSNVVRFGLHDWALAYVEAPAGSGDLRLLHCQNADCSVFNTRVILDQVGSDSHQIRDLQLVRANSGALHLASIDVETSANPLLRYRLTTCATPSCPSPDHQDLVAAVPTPDFDHAALAVRTDGRPILLDPRTANPALIECANANCSGQRVHRPLPNEAGDWYAGLLLDASDMPVMGHIRGNEAGFLQCLDAICVNNVSNRIALPLSSPLTATLNRNAQGDLLLSHIDREEGVAHATRCVSPILFAADFEGNGASSLIAR